MNDVRAHAPAALQPIGRLRVRLTVWYAATLCAILGLLGFGLFETLSRQDAAQLDASLHEAAVELARAARIREMEAVSARGSVVDAVDELHIPDRVLYLLAADGQPIKPDSAPTWVVDAARRATASGSVDVDHESPREKRLRLHAERFALDDGRVLVAAAVADKVELEDRFAALIAAFSGAALVALVLVAVGGSVLVRQSTKPIERSIAHMRRFMADAAHELRTPLTVLRNRAEIALQQARDADAYIAALRGIEAESERLGRIVDQLLTLARADTGEQPIDRSRVFLDDLTLDAADAARIVAQRHHVAVEMSEFEEAVIVGDAALLRQLAMILLDNAVKFTAAGGTVRVSVTGNGAAARPTLTVEDTGAGIPPEQLPHVFERFYRGDPARSRVGRVNGNASSDGAGLGLSIARWIADVHGADITLASEVGSGTRVTVQFPVAAGGSNGLSSS